MTNSRNKASAKRGMKAAEDVKLLSDEGQLPAYNIDDYADLVSEARQKFDRLCQFSSDQVEDWVKADADISDWEAARAQAVTVLDRYSGDAFQVIIKLAQLIHSVRDSKRLIQLCDAECTAKKLARQKK